MLASFRLFAKQLFHLIDEVVVLKPSLGILRLKRLYILVSVALRGFPTVVSEEGAVPSVKQR
ncbi:hypothetical protein [Methylobacterium persicinum]|uniref:Transposase DDE domain-containing protein n=1 Tax=Methylobacterium persicinum TaxID=374426 RepID=A0ABU0HT31_9HYPH|nr:hypothetical protein [Methylobacterium persicinum]MDQ0445488.1 hypothetical protein [Methylobacterium persicinum]